MSTNTQIIERSTRHQVMIQRLGSSQVKALMPILKSMAADVRARLMDMPTEFQANRLNLLLLDIRELITDAGGRFQNELFDNMAEFAEYEAGFTQRLMAPLIKVDTTLPASEQIRAALTRASARVVSGDQIKQLTIREMVDQFTTGKRRAVEVAVRSGFIEGQTTQQIAQNVQRITGVQAPRQAETLIRTATNHAGSVAREAFYLENSDVIDEEEWVATLDARTTILCAGRDGQKYPVGQGPQTPAHFNCLSGDTFVSTCSAVSNVYKRRYKGRMVNITTQSGRTLKITPNHPILTLRGWVAAGSLNSFDKIVPADALNIDLGEYYKDSVESTFCDLFSAANVSVNPLSVRNRPISPKDFHGDVTVDAEVEIVSLDSPSWLNVKKMLIKDVINNRFIFRSLVNAPLHCLGKFMPFFARGFTASNGLMGFFGKPRNFLRSASGHACKLLFRSISKVASLFSQEPGHWNDRTINSGVPWNARGTYSGVVGIEDRSLFGVSEVDNLDRSNGDVVLNKNSLNRPVADSEFFADPLNSPAFDCSKVDNIVDLFVGEYDGHVYNLENDDNWYVSNGIITHNCRSLRVAVVKPEFTLFGEDPGERASMDGPVSANKTYSGWLRDQGAEFQNDVLGPERARLFRSGEVRLDGFVDDMGRMLTLDELRAREGLTLG